MPDSRTRPGGSRPAQQELTRKPAGSGEGRSTRDRCIRRTGRTSVGRLDMDGVAVTGVVDTAAGSGRLVDVAG
jgi:hypothetical protein